MTESLNRPQIPAELKRRVLLEAGHRCAIPTCKFPDVDIHHIVPWAKVKEHNFNNLIALCPNCHRRAHNGEIDKKSLFQYKARLNALFGPELLRQNAFVKDPKAWVKSLTDNYTAELYSEKSEEGNYSIHIEYPQFYNQKALFLNEIIKEKISHIGNHLIDISINEERYSDIEFYVSGSFHIGINTNEIISLRSNLSTYCGGAHNSDWVEVYNYRLETLSSIHIEDLFVTPRFGIKAISDYSIDAIMTLQNFRNLEDVQSGAGPENKNFESFNITPKGLLITFGPYQIGCYAAGPAEILVPFSEIRPFCNEFFEVFLEKNSINNKI